MSPDKRPLCNLVKLADYNRRLAAGLNPSQVEAIAKLAIKSAKNIDFERCRREHLITEARIKFFKFMASEDEARNSEILDQSPPAPS